MIVHGVGGKLITPSNIEIKCHLVESMRENDMVFAIGPAGTENHTGVALAVQVTSKNKVKRIISN
ncbi:MAG: PhoH family protein [Gelidibacter sp.]